MMMKIKSVIKYLTHHLCVYSIVSDSVTPWTAAYQSPLSMEFSRQKYWVAISYPRGYFAAQRLNPLLLHLLHWQADSLPLHYLDQIVIMNISLNLALNCIQLQWLIDSHDLSLL